MATIKNNKISDYFLQIKTEEPYIIIPLVKKGHQKI